MKNKIFNIIILIFFLIALGIAATMVWENFRELKLKVLTNERKILELNEALNKAQEEIQTTKLEISHLAENVAIRLNSLSEAVKTQIKQIADLNEQIGEISVRLGLQARKIAELIEKEEIYKKNIEKAKRSTAILHYEILEKDEFLDKEIVQIFRIQCSGIIYKITPTTVFVITNRHCIDWTYGTKGDWSQIDPYETDKIPEIVSENIKIEIRGEIYDALSIFKTPFRKVDLAVVSFLKPLKIDFEAAELEPILPSVGEPVVALGAPIGLEYTVTQGIVSAIRRDTTLFDYPVDLIQTDAAIHKGNSGGGLYRLSDGKLIGINTFGITEAPGLNFAISVKTFLEFSPP